MSQGSVRCPLLVGRDGLLEVAERRLDEVRAGAGRFLLVAGEAGVGKSRFLDAVAQRATQRGFLVARSATTPLDLDVPAASIHDLGRAMARVPELEGVGQALISIGATRDVPNHTRRRRLVMETVDTLTARATRPIAWFFEDLQWTDELSLEIIAELARQAPSFPILLVASYRSDEAPTGSELRAWRSRLVTQRLAEEVRLEPLSETDTALAIALILDNGLPAPRDVVAAVYERTDGVPLHIEELLGALDQDARSDGSAIREASVPDTIEDAVLARLARCAPEARAVAGAASIVGRAFVPETVADLLEVPIDRVDDALAELLRAGIAVRSADDTRFDFRHQLLRDAVYRSVGASERRRLHARAAERLERTAGDTDMDASLHYERAGLRDEAYRSAMASARAADRLSANREAFELYRRAARHLPAGTPALERGSLYLAITLTATAVERMEVCIESAHMAASAFREGGRPDLAFVVLEHVASIARRQGDPSSQRRAIMEDEAVQVAALPPSPERSRARAVVMLRLAVEQLDAFDLAAAAGSVTIAREEASAIDDPDLLLQAELLDAERVLVGGDADRGFERLARVATDLEAIGSLEALGAYRDGSELAARQFRYPTAIRLVEAGTEFARLTEQRHCAHVMAGVQAFVEWARGDWDGAVSRAEHAIADHGCERAKAVARWSVGLVGVGRGDAHRAVAALEASVAFAERAEAHDLWATPWWGLAESDLCAGRAGDAWRRCALAADRLIGTAPPVLLVPYLVTGVRAAFGGADPDAARRWLARIDAEVADIPEATPALDHARGLIALAGGSTGMAREALSAALDGWLALERVWEASWARLDLVSCLTRTNAFAEAVAMAEQVRTVALTIDSPVLRERVEVAARLARSRVADEEPWRPLTAREFAVAKLIADGLTNAQIGDELGIAPKTASSHVEHILAKLGVSRRAEIATWTASIDRRVSQAVAR